MASVGNSGPLLSHVRNSLATFLGRIGYDELSGSVDHVPFALEIHDLLMS
jgi:hypothetical protein